jgi:hypothetical protein
MENNPQLYIPQGAETLEHLVLPQFRIGIQGPAGEGKTHSSLTFPNPVLCNFNRGHGAHIGRKDVLDVPFYNDSFVDKQFPKKTGFPSNRKDAFLSWSKKEAPKLTPLQTLVIDSGTDVEKAFHTQEALEPSYSDKGKLDKFAVWRNKINYFNDISTALKNLECSLIWISHETKDRNDDGELNGKIKPLLSGQSGDTLLNEFTDWFRQMSGDKKVVDKITPEILKLWGFKTVKEYQDMQDLFDGNSIYFWQTESSDTVTCKRSSFINMPRFVPAYYSVLCKYLRQNQNPK